MPANTSTNTHSPRRTYRFALLAAVVLVLAALGAGGGAPQVAPASSAAPGALAVTPAGKTLTATDPATGLEYAADHVIVQMDPGVRAASLIGEYGVDSPADIEQASGVTTVDVPAGSNALEFADTLADDPSVAYACPDYARYPLAYAVPPNDPLYASTTPIATFGSVVLKGSWWLTGYGMDMASVWGRYDNAERGALAPGSDVQVAVIDTGFYTDHPDKGSNIIPKKDEFQSWIAGSPTWVTDDDVTPAPWNTYGSSVSYSAHGTGVAGEIAAATNNNLGVASASYDSQVYVYKAAGLYYPSAAMYPDTPTWAMFDAAIIRCINDAVADGAEIINMSLGSTAYSTALANATTNAIDAGVLVVAATGNEGASNGVYYPAANPGVIGVGAYYYDSSGNRARASLTNYGLGADPFAPNAAERGLDILAPGVNIYSLGDPHISGSEYLKWSGTSMAAPAFAGAAAAVWRFAPNLTPTQLMNILYASAIKQPGTTSPSEGYGYGYVDPDAAVDAIYARTITLSGESQSEDVATTLSGTLVDGGGNPQAGATVTFERSATGSAPWTAFTVATTNANGAWSFSYNPTSAWERQQTIRAVYAATAASGTTPASDGATATLLLNMTVRATELTLVAPTVRYDQSTTLSGALTAGGTSPLAGMPVVLTRSADGGATWSGLATVTTGNDGSWSYAYNPSATWERNQLVRATFTDASGDHDSAAATQNLGMTAYLSTPTLSTTSPRAKRAFTISAYLKPRFAVGTQPVRAYFYRRTSTGSYVYVKSVLLKSSNYLTYTKIAGSAYMPTTGTYRVRLNFYGTTVPTAAGYWLTGTLSPYRYFTVK